MNSAASSFIVDSREGHISDLTATERERARLTQDSATATGILLHGRHQEIRTDGRMMGYDEHIQGQFLSLRRVVPLSRHRADHAQSVQQDPRGDVRASNLCELARLRINNIWWQNLLQET